MCLDTDSATTPDVVLYRYIDSIISKVKKEDLIEKVTTKVATDSAWQFYKFLGIAFPSVEVSTTSNPSNTKFFFILLILIDAQS